MARKQVDYLNSLLSDGPAEESPARPAPPRPDRTRGTTLLGRESALARVAAGEVRQVTQLMLDPARVRVWPGNARSYAHLSEANCRELIDSLIAEGGQKVPVVVRRIEGEKAFDYEVIAGTRRHWSISWLRAHSYPEMMLLAQVAVLDDEAAFRLADIENRARADVSDLERARNYAGALSAHYGNHLTRMAERLKLSKGWLSKMIKVASIPDEIVAAFASPGDVQLKPAYALAQVLDNARAAKAVAAEARRIAVTQARTRDEGGIPLAAAEVVKRLLAAPTPPEAVSEPYRHASRYGRTMVSVQSANRQGVTLRLHNGSGGDREEVIAAIRDALDHLDHVGKGLVR